MLKNSKKMEWWNYLSFFFWIFENKHQKSLSFFWILVKIPTFPMVFEGFWKKQLLLGKSWNFQKSQKKHFENSIIPSFQLFFCNFEKIKEDGMMELPQFFLHFWKWSKTSKKPQFFLDFGQNSNFSYGFWKKQLLLGKSWNFQKSPKKTPREFHHSIFPAVFWQCWKIQKRWNDGITSVFFAFLKIPTFT